MSRQRLETTTRNLLLVLLACSLAGLVGTVLLLSSLIELRSHQDGAAGSLLLAGGLFVVVAVVLLAIYAAIYWRAMQKRKALQQ
jgi:hypothetical protein